MLINDRLSTILTQYAGEMAFVQRSQYKKQDFRRNCSETTVSPHFRLMLFLARVVDISCTVRQSTIPCALLLQQKSYESIISGQ